MVALHSVREPMLEWRWSCVPGFSFLETTPPIFGSLSVPTMLHDLHEETRIFIYIWKQDIMKVMWLLFLYLMWKESQPYEEEVKENAIKKNEKGWGERGKRKKGCFDIQHVRILKNLLLGVVLTVSLLSTWVTETWLSWIFLDFSIQNDFQQSAIGLQVTFGLNQLQSVVNQPHTKCSLSQYLNFCQSITFYEKLLFPPHYFLS